MPTIALDPAGTCTLLVVACPYRLPKFVKLSAAVIDPSLTLYDAMFFLYALILIGPNFANTLLPKPLVNDFATKAPAKVAVICCFLLITLLCNTLIPPAMSPLSIACTAWSAPVDCARLSAVPASIALMLKLLFALRLGALRLGAM
jgi:hypothetical protein